MHVPNQAVKSMVAATVLATLAACSSTNTGPSRADSTQQAVSQAALTPLNDLNLVRADIPEVLRTAVKAPYAHPTDKSCSALVTQVEMLDAALGADLDTPPTATNPGLVERGTSAAQDAAHGALRRTAEGAIPFRGWVRKLSGAERYSREVSAAIAAGTIRRAYLKGLGQAAGCSAPASPREVTK